MLQNVTVGPSLGRDSIEAGKRAGLMGAVLVVLFMVLLPSILLGSLACDSAEKILGKDSGQIVVDEFCGYLLSVMFLPRNALILFAAFILFRLFDR